MGTKKTHEIRNRVKTDGTELALQNVHLPNVVLERRDVAETK